MTIKDIALEAGVSTQTVSRYFNSPEMLSDKIKTKISPVIEKYDYTPNTSASNLRSGSLNTILIIVSTFTNPYYSTIIDGILSNAKKYSFSYTLVHDHEFITVEQVKSYFKSNKYKGVILLSGNLQKESVKYMYSNLNMISNAQYGCQNELFYCSDEFKSTTDLITEIACKHSHNICFLIGKHSHTFTKSERIRAASHFPYVDIILYDEADEIKFLPIYESYDVIICYNDLQMFHLDIEIGKRNLDILTTSFDGTYLCNSKRIYIYKDARTQGINLMKLLNIKIHNNDILSKDFPYQLISK